MEEINRLIEEEIERRTTERITCLLESISESFDISMKSLLKCTIKNIDEKVTRCLGITKSKTRCKNTPKDNGYCKVHNDQYKPPVKSTSIVVKHNHTLPPLYKEGCPACERKQVRELNDIFENGEI
jgi:hypothetical protein